MDDRRILHLPRTGFPTKPDPARGKPEGRHATRCARRTEAES